MLSVRNVTDQTNKFEILEDMDEVKLIQLVKYHDLLYDPDNKDYTSKIRKEQVWDDIGRQLKRSGEYTLRKEFCKLPHNR